MFTNSPSLALMPGTGLIFIKEIMKPPFRAQVPQCNLSAHKLIKCSASSLLLLGCPRLAHFYHSITLLSFNLMRGLAIFSPSNSSQLVIPIFKPLKVLAISQFTSAVTSKGSINITNRVTLTIMDLAAPKLQSRTSRLCTECMVTLWTLLKKRNLDRLIVSEIIKRLKDPKISRIPGFSVSVHLLTPLNLRMAQSKATPFKNLRRFSTRRSGMINRFEGRKTDNRQNVRLIWTSRGTWMRWLNRNRELERMKSDG